MNTDNMQEIPEAFKADNKLHVKLYFKGAPLPFPIYFVKIVFYVKLAWKCILVNLPIYIKTQTENIPSILGNLSSTLIYTWRIANTQVQKANVFIYCIPFRGKFCCRKLSPPSKILSLFPNKKLCFCLEPFNWL